MARIDTTFDSLTDLAADGFGSVSDALAADERSRKKLVFLLLLAVVALLGFLAWKKSSSAGEPEAETA